MLRRIIVNFVVIGGIWYGHGPIATALAEDIVVDFWEAAPTARWTNAWQELSFPGVISDQNGFAVYANGAEFEDQKIYDHALETHPHQQPRGVVIGRYSGITIPQEGAEFRAEIGFLKGALDSDGVYFEIRAEFQGYSGIPLRREYHKNYTGYLITDFSQDLSRFRGMTGTILLSVDAGEKSSANDWAAWVKPRLVSMKNEFRFGGFTGAAVGSSREGDKLLDAWGGKSGRLFGDIVMHLAFAKSDTEMPFTVIINSFYNDANVGTTNLGTLAAGQTSLWHTLTRTQRGPWREEIILDGTYVGDIRYNISDVGE